jgi:hypothetical protein
MDKTKAKVGVKQTTFVGPQWFQCGPGSGILGQYESGSKVWKTKTCKKCYSQNKFLKLKTATSYFLYHGFHKGRSRNLQPSKENSGHFKA